MIRYVDSLSQLSEASLHGFFVGWPDPPTPKVHYEILCKSQHALLAVDGENNRVVGFVTAISDGVLSAYIPLLEVLPSYQGKGIGSELTKRMLQKLDHLYMVDLICDAELQPFYERFSLRRATGMILRNYAQQRGDRIPPSDTGEA